MATDRVFSVTLESCLQRAEEAGRLAAASNLPNVKLRHLASEKAWRQMAASIEQNLDAAANRDAAWSERRLKASMEDDV